MRLSVCEEILCFVELLIVIIIIISNSNNNSSSSSSSILTKVPGLSRE